MKLDRLLGILTVLLQNERVTAPALAERFEVSRRTITRDIDALCQAGIPVVTAQGSGGGIWIAEGYKLDKSVLTYDELADILASLKGLGTVAGGTQLERTLEKLTPHPQETVMSLRENIIIDLASNARDSLRARINLLRGAIRAARPVSFEYVYEKGKTARTVEPYVLIFQWSAWYLFGYCRARQDWRLFHLRRMVDLSVSEESFAPQPIPEGRLDFEGLFPDDLPLVALFEPSERYQLIDGYGPDCYTVQPDGRLRLEIGYTNRSYTLRWLLGFGDKVEVLHPQDIADEIRRQAENILRRS